MSIARSTVVTPSPPRAPTTGALYRRHHRRAVSLDPDIGIFKYMVVMIERMTLTKIEQYAYGGASADSWPVPEFRNTPGRLPSAS